MVLQQGLPLPVWGMATPGEKVAVALGDEKEISTFTGANGHWQVVLPPRPASTEPKELVIRGENEIRIRDVLVGEVWLGSGQSNMALVLRRTQDSERVQAAAGAGAYPLIRIFKSAYVAADQRRDDPEGTWQTVTPDSVKEFSGVLFYFGEALQRAQPGVPIGLILSAVGGTNAYSWIPPEVIAQGDSFAFLRQWYTRQVELYPQRKQDYLREVETYAQKTAGLDATAKADAGIRPKEPMGPENPKRPSAYFNGMIAPLIPLAIRGVLWYQGENDALTPRSPAADVVVRASHYAMQMEALITGWRKEWSEKSGNKTEFPFFLAQLPGYESKTGFWPDLREQQLKVVEQVPHSGIICLIDVGDPNEIHYANKTPVGERFARLARALVYGDRIIPTSPMVRDAKFSGSEVVLEFDNVQGGLASSDGQALRNFEVAGKDGQFVPAAATVEGERVKVTKEGLSELTAVRYAWENSPEPVNLQNMEGLPAFPFQIWSPTKTNVPQEKTAGQ